MPPFPSPRDSPCRLLLLDPHPLLRHGVQELLARQTGLQVDGSYGRSGDLLQRLQQAAAIDLLLVDALPIGDSGEGLELLRHVSRHWPAVPILVLSAHCNAGVVSLALQAGARGFLSKACAPQMLLRAVSVVARGGRFVPPELRAQLNQSRRQRQQSMRSPRLSTRERAVLQWVLRGCSTGEMARRSGRAASTISTQKRAAYRKLGIRNDGELFRFRHLIDAD
ncbi:TPA: response regulator transcription factor [Stenotrophomonas maltophilia]|uniref:response regulator transcription factor n=1 Tax=Stenotrophomonas maltophilia TaxID=40324 RepID=UPI002E79B088|nr:response regulator transcription factor [Stenotrophomonas maltophilia]HDS1012888.1 response regulator transcription factor [Stenotrophomonas maltophilia]HDS1021850.1 response regulator transcription factor [Stenotrophomonas maltophilia]